ncbi:uncharacterized protein LOC127869505 isoform X2 [Dreissena polymorpha]|uniref:uncharacterized protein LOC127869505 isoform X2 n=1 Tax=Dreissena polymorpha TaxID=45954 RepID=UPI002264C60B|nr:uncharacterized protein LOC127869505 isoform X2 [Dreissena polymorpha]
MDYTSVVLLTVPAFLTFGQLPDIYIYNRDGIQYLLCNTSWPSSSFSVYKNDKYVMSVKFGSMCSKIHGEIKVHCECKGNSSVECNITEHNCSTWMCDAPMDNVLIKSNVIKSCPNASINSTNQLSNTSDCVDCSAVTTCTDRLQWVVGGINFSDTSIQANYFTRGNISFISHIFQRENNGSVVVCQHGNGEVNPWRIMIIIPPSICAYNNSIKTKHETANSCPLLNGNPKVKIRTGDCSKPEVNKSLGDMHFCEALNKTGNQTFVGNANGRFELIVLDPASVTEFYFEGKENQDNITINKRESITLICKGQGNPPPDMMLIHDNSTLSINTSSVKHTLQLTESTYSMTFTCRASNGLDSDSKFIYATVILSYSHSERKFIFIVIIGFVTAVIVIVLAVSMILMKRQGIVFCKRIIFVTDAAAVNDELPAAAVIALADFPENETTENKDDLTSAFANETYAGCLDMEREANHNPHNEQGFSHRSRQDLQNPFEPETIIDDLLYSYARDPEDQNKVTNAAEHRTKWLKTGNVGEDFTYSVVNKSTRPDANNCSAVHQKQQSKVLINSVSKNTKGHDDNTYRIVNKPKRGKGNITDEERSVSSWEKSMSRRTEYQNCENR